MCPCFLLRIFLNLKQTGPVKWRKEEQRHAFGFGLKTGLPWVECSKVSYGEVSSPVSLPWNVEIAFPLFCFFLTYSLHTHIFLDLNLMDADLYGTHGVTILDPIDTLMYALLHL